MIAAFDLPKTICKEVIEKARGIGIDIGKKKCIVYVMDSKGRVLEEVAYDSMLADAQEFAGRMKRECDRNG